MLLSPGKSNPNIARAVHPRTQTLGTRLGFHWPLSCQASESCRKKMFLEQKQVCPAKLSKHSTRKQECRARL